jgi:hypothetical protein
MARRNRNPDIGHPIRLLVFIGLCVVSLVGCQADHAFVPKDEDASAMTQEMASEEIANELMARAGWIVEPDSAATQLNEQPSDLRGHGVVTRMEREVITGNIAHYWFEVRTGRGPYDKIGIHRVVREARPNHPIRTRNSVFLHHGDYKDFVGCFLSGKQAPSYDDGFGFAAYLAAGDIDVWGIDQAWTLVPEGVTDFSFMASWGMERSIDDLDGAVLIARIVRRLCGNGDQAMILSGYSGGSPPAIGLVNRETHRSPMHRNISGLIPVDEGVLTDVQGYQDVICPAVEMYQSRIDAGQYEDHNPLPSFGIPAQTDPSGPSQIPGFEGLTNLQAAFILGTSPFFPPMPMHFLAGNFDAYGIPTGLLYTDVGLYVDFLADAPPYMPNAFLRDEYVTNCPGHEVMPWTDNLRQIRVPVLYVSAEGGFGFTGLHTLDEFGSTDISRIHVSISGDPQSDFAHLDLFLAADAPMLAWDQIRTWISTHSPH